MAFETFRIPEYSGGQVDFFDPRLIENNQSPELRNCYIDTVGRLSSRGGQSFLNVEDLAGGGIQGLYSYYHGNERRIMVVSGGVLYFGNYDTKVFTPIKASLSTVNDFEFVTGVNYLMSFDGSQPLKWDGNPANVPDILGEAPLTGKYPIYHAEKVFVAVDDDTVRWCDSFQPESWPDVNYFDFGRGDGDSIMGFAKYLGSLLVFKRYSIWDLQGTSLSNMRGIQKEKRNGAVSPRGIISNEPYVYYIGYNGIFRWDGYQPTNLVEQKIPKLWEKVNKAYLHKSCAGRDPNTGLILFSIPINDSTEPNFVLAWDQRFNSWWPWDSISAKVFSEFDTGNGKLLLSGLPSVSRIIIQNEGNNDLGVAINSYHISKEHDDGAPEYIKKYKKAYIADASGAGEMVFSYRVNGGSWISPSPLSDKDDVRRFSISQNARYFQARVSHNVIDEGFSIRNLAIRFFRKKAQ